MLNDQTDNVTRLRQLVVDNIKSNPHLYNDAILGRPVSDYCDWILKQNSWGGAIEIGIFANQFQTSIFACDATSGNIIRFGDYPSGCFVMYSGIHYEYSKLLILASLVRVQDGMHLKTLIFAFLKRMS